MDSMAQFHPIKDDEPVTLAESKSDFPCIHEIRPDES